MDTDHSTQRAHTGRDNESAPAPHPRTIGWVGTTALAVGGSNQSLFLIGGATGLIATQGSAAVPLLILGLLLSWMALPGWLELVLMWPNRVGGIVATCAEAFRPIVSKRLMTAMGGTLQVQSTIGLGSIFSIELQEATSPAEESSGATDAVHDLDEEIQADQTYTVLCIEDNASNLRLFEVLLESRPEITLRTATEGSTGLDLARLSEPDLILLDLNLPDMHGREVLAKLQQSALTKDIPVVVISADATASQIEDILNAGARHYLTKPLDVEQFMSVINRLLPPAVADI